MTQKSTSDDGRSNASTSSGTPVSGAAPQGSSTGKDALQTVAREARGEVSHLASGIADEARKAAETKLGAGKDFAAEHLGSVADALRKTSKSLGSENVVTSYIEKAAGSVDSVSEYFQTRTLSQLVNDVEGYARREPAVFLGGAFFIGMLGGRFLKAATPAPQAQTAGGPSGQGARSGSDTSRSGQGNRQGQREYQGARAPQSGGAGSGQGSKQGSSGPKGSPVSTGQASGSQHRDDKSGSDKPATDKSGNDKSGEDKSGADKSGASFAERATEPGYKGAGGSGAPPKGSGAS